MNNGKCTNTGDRVQKFLSRVSLQAAIPYLTVGILLIVVIIFAGHEIERHIKTIESFIAHLGPWSVFVFLVIFIAAASLLLPDSVLCIIAGALFGLGLGFAVALAGSMLAGTIQFMLSRKFLRSWVQKTVVARSSLSAIQRAVLSDEFRLQIFLRLTPLNPATISYLLGAAGVRFSGFIVALTAITPHLIIEVYFGHVGKHIARLTASGTRSTLFQEAMIIGGLAVCIAVVVFISKMARKAITQAVADTEKMERSVLKPLNTIR